MTKHGQFVLNELTLASATEWRPGAAEWAFLLICEGRGYCFADSATMELEAGDAILISEPEGSEFRASQLGALKLRYFSLNSARLACLLTLIERQRLAGLARAKPRFRHFPSDHALAPRFSETGTLRCNDQSLEVRLRLLQMFAAALASDLAPDGRLACHTAVPNARDRFLDLVAGLTEEEFWGHSLKSLAEHCRCTERHFGRLFHQQFGQTIKSSHVEYRLKRAKHLLEDTELKVVDVALECGYRHSGPFIVVFKQHFGVTPSECRRQAQAGVVTGIDANGRH